MGVSEWVFLLVPAYSGCPGPKAVKRLCVCVCCSTVLKKPKRMQFQFSQSLIFIHIKITTQSNVKLAVMSGKAEITWLADHVHWGKMGATAQLLVLLPNWRIITWGARLYLKWSIIEDSTTSEVKQASVALHVTWWDTATYSIFTAKSSVPIKISSSVNKYKKVNSLIPGVQDTILLEDGRTCQRSDVCNSRNSSVFQ